MRMAAGFGATIVPFAAVGEDDLLQLVLDSIDLMKIPKLSGHLKDSSRGTVRIRDESSGELRKNKSLIQWFCPKLPGRYYYLFGMPIETKRKKEILIKDKEKARELYLQIQSDLENSLAYLIKKREDDPCRNVFDRIVHRMTYSAIHEVPTFEP